MKKHIGKCIALIGVVVIYPLSSVLAPWITRMLFSHRMPDGQIVILNVSAGLNGFLVCLSIGVILLLTGIFIEVRQALRNRQNKNPKQNIQGTSLPRRP